MFFQIGLGFGPSVLGQGYLGGSNERLGKEQCKRWKMCLGKFGPR
ncbi:hypothetical protein V6Z11_D11G392200 [Gossypium hirsutum]